MPTKPTTASRQDLIAAVAMIQNHPAHSHHDILTFCGWRDVTLEDIERHIEANLRIVSDYANRGGRRLCLVK